MHDVARLRFTSRKLSAIMTIMQSLRIHIMRIFDAIGRLFLGSREPADALRRDLGLVEKETPGRDWWDYV
ncbi:hypothetical protein VE25_10590 [Devosia geojensis]|uniref:Uncharacterized protein n=1 Tax=Devosia geojensis TaxID=443610 RepID=A0A0F5FSF6_9HYPH|nr:hypothetical protein [Devosia geojensis]KKB11809.1 hypothetical protein VE25_10590 [Devosia geojensis]